MIVPQMEVGLERLGELHKMVGDVHLLVVYTRDILQGCEVAKSWYSLIGCL